MSNVPSVSRWERGIFDTDVKNRSPRVLHRDRYLFQRLLSQDSWLKSTKRRTLRRLRLGVWQSGHHKSQSRRSEFLSRSTSWSCDLVEIRFDYGNNVSFTIFRVSFCRPPPSRLLSLSLSVFFFSLRCFFFFFSTGVWVPIIMFEIPHPLLMYSVKRILIYLKMFNLSGWGSKIST